MVRSGWGRAAALAGLLLTAAGSSARAQASWVQIEALPTLARAEERARAWSTAFADVAGFRLGSGWYAIALGPYGREEAQRRLAELKASAAIPRDSYLAEDASLGPRFWPVGADALTRGEAIPGAEPPASGELAPLAPANPAGPEAAVEEAVPAGETLAEARRLEAQLSAEERRAVQEALRFEGLYDAGIDGAFGSGTRAAMAAWQEGQGVEATGVLTSAQRAALLAAYRGDRDSLGLALVEAATAGIALQLPLALLAPPQTRAPFVHYGARDGSGVQVLLISQPGDAAVLTAIFHLVQALEAVPADGPRRLDASGFTLEGRDARHLVHAQARLAENHIKGFVLIWPGGDDRRQALALAAMRESFRALPGAVLPDPAREGATQTVDLLAGLDLRRPAVARTGFYIDARGHVLTSADAVISCQRVTLEEAIPARVLARDDRLGVALLAPEAPVAPLAHARWRAEPLEPGTEIAVAGYAWEGRLGGAVVSFGRLLAAEGPDGTPDRQRLQLEVTPGEAGAPILDGSGAVAGLLLAEEAGRLLPEGVRFALPEASIRAFLAQPPLAGLWAPDPEPVSALASPPLLSASALGARARDMTVAVGCWN